MAPTTLTLALALACLQASPPPPHASFPRAAAVLAGTDFRGGAGDLFGTTKGGEIDVNYVYARPNGARSKMRAVFALANVPPGPQRLYLRARDDDGPGACRIAITVNGAPVFEGPNAFSAKRFEARSFALPGGALRIGQNEVTIANAEPQGPVGNPPWFMVAACAIAPPGYRFGHDLARDFRVELPAAERPFPEPLPEGARPGFALRGIKGWMWSPAQYLAEIPVLARCKMNFLMNCYTSMCDVEHYRWGDPNVNRWWEDLPQTKKRAYEKVVRRCQKEGIQFCFSMNPNLCSKRPLDYASAADLDALWKHYAWMQSLGVRWFNVSLDDISKGIDAAGQARAVNDLYARLKARDPQAKMIFTPTFYWGDGAEPEAKAYLEVLARDLAPDVYLFWTGDSVVGTISRKAAETYRSIARHRLIVWDNYPVNDANPTMHLGPVINRDADLCAVADGYMSNSMCQQNEGNRVPMLTCADYAWNPTAYDPERSVGQAILHLERTQAARGALRELVEAYPGCLLWGQPSTAVNPVRERLSRILALPHPRPVAEGYAAHLEQLAARLDRACPGRYRAEKKTLRDDIAYVRGVLHERYEQEPAGEAE